MNAYRVSNKRLEYNLIAEYVEQIGGHFALHFLSAK